MQRQVQLTCAMILSPWYLSWNHNSCLKYFLKPKKIQKFELWKMEILTVKNIAQSCSSLQKYNDRPEKGKICMNFSCIRMMHAKHLKIWLRKYSGSQVGFEVLHVQFRLKMAKICRKMHVENPRKEIEFVLSLKLKLNFIKSDVKSDSAAKMLKEEGNKNYKLKVGFRC